MAKNKAARPTANPSVPFDVEKFENVQQVGGIQSAMMECPPGSGQFRRVALVNTGSPLRFTVALDRGGDIVDCTYAQHSLTYLSMNGIKAPSHAYHQGIEWLYGWPGGLLTTCGPQYAGVPREEDGWKTNLHGRHSSQPAAVEMMINPDPHRGRYEMLLTMTVRDTRLFEPSLEVRRTITCTLGVPEIRLFDEVTNRGNTKTAHTMLYHVNLGYPLLDEGARTVLSGTLDGSWNSVQGQPLTTAVLEQRKRIPAPLPEHRGRGERGSIVQPVPDANGDIHVGLINEKLGLAFEMIFPAAQLPRVANWQHFGPRGSYVTGVEPFSGSLRGKAIDKNPVAEQWLEPGETKRYQLTLRVHNDPAAMRAFAKYDGKIAVK